MISQLETTFDLDCSSCPRSLAIYSESLSSTLEEDTDTARFSMVYGTERGSLHYRSFPISKSSSSFLTAPTVDYVGTPGGVIQSGAIIGCIPAWLPYSTHRSDDTQQKVNSSSLKSTTKTSSFTTAHAMNNSIWNQQQQQQQQHESLTDPSTTQVMLLLRDDNRGVGGAHSTSPGAYAASLILLQHSNFTALTSIPSIIYPSMTYTTTAAATTTTTTLGNLPRMSCASYHPNTGFVYAAGTSVCSVPPNVLYAVALTLALAMNHNHISSPPSSSTTSVPHTNRTTPYPSSSSSSPTPSSYYSFTSANMQRSLLSNLQSLLPTYYFYAKNILPPPGARCTGSGCNEALALVCHGRVAIIPVGNSFWAVPGISIPNRLSQIWKHISSSSTTTTAAAVTNATMDGSHNIPTSWDTFVDELPPLANQAIMKSGLNKDTSTTYQQHHRVEKILTFHQSSQVHPTIVIEIPTTNNSKHNTATTFRQSGESWTGNNPSATTIKRHIDNTTIIPSLLFLASGKECAVLEIFYNPNKVSTTSSLTTNTSSPDIHHTTEMPLYEEATVVDHEETKGLIGGCILYGHPRHGIITLPSPIVSAVGLPLDHTPSDEGSYHPSPMVAILTADGMIDVRSFSCIAVPLSSISIGTRPNDYFLLRSSLPNHGLIALSYSGQATLVSTRADTPQDFSDRFMKLCIDAFGSTGFPRTLLAEAMGTSFSATTYTGIEPTLVSKNTLKQYLETILGLDVNDDYGPAMIRSLHHQRDVFYNILLLCCTGILCLVCAQLSPPNAALSNRAAKACSMHFGVVSSVLIEGIHDSVVQLIQQVVDSLLREASNFVLLAPSSSTILNPNIRSSNKTGLNMDLTETALWLLRACGNHQRAIEVLQDFMTNPSLRNKGTGSIASMTGQVSWTQGKFESYLTSHLSELWICEDEECKQIVLRSTATRQLLENNPKMGLSIFTNPLSQNRDVLSKSDNVSNTIRIPMYCSQVVEMLKSIRTRCLTTTSIESTLLNANCELPLESGLALAITFLESAIGITMDRSTTYRMANGSGEGDIESLSDLHDQLAILLLEAIILERNADNKEADSTLGNLYRKKLHRLLKWPHASLRSERLIAVLPSAFLQERALLLGRLGQHKEALQILYCELHSLDMALEYCDVIHMRKTNPQGDDGKKSDLSGHSECAYLPLVSVVLGSDPNPQRGISAAINILSLRRNSINLTSALRLLPTDLPVSVIARPFLIPSIIENESEVRRLKMISSLLRAKYISLKRSLIEEQIRSKSDIESIAIVQKIDIGDLLNVSRPFHLYPIHRTVYFPQIEVTKYFYPRYLVLQAKITNLNRDKPLANVALHVAESSDEALIPSFTVPVKILLPNITGVSWCILTSSPQRFDGVSTLACELRYTVLDIDPVSGVPLNFSSETDDVHRALVEELHDIEIRHTDYFGPRS